MRARRRDRDRGLLPHPVHTHGLGDIFDRLRPQVFIAQSQLALHLLVNAPGDANASARGQALQTSGDVHAIAVDAFSVDDDIPQIDAHAKPHPTLGWKRSISDAEISLDGDRALHGMDDAGKLREYVIPGESTTRPRCSCTRAWMTAPETVRV